jgi:hypothetical protein
MLREFEEADQMLSKVCATSIAPYLPLLTIEQIVDAAKSWRDAWSDILTHQLAMIEEFNTLYKPLGAKGEAFGSHVPADTPRTKLERAERLREAYAELKTDMLEEIKAVDAKLISPAKTARDSIKPMKKVIKKREDKKVCPAIND